MREKIIIKKDSIVLYKGNILDLPMKEDIIIQKSIEVFGDDDPCIIHQSFIVKELVSDLLDIFKSTNNSKVNVKEFREILSFIDFDDLDSITIELVK